MWAMFKKLFSLSRNLNALLGDVVFITPREHGIYGSSYFEWRVKTTIDKNKLYIAVAMKPDGYAGAEGSPTNYINFELDAAVRLRDNLNDCIEFMQRESKAMKSLQTEQKS